MFILLLDDASYVLTRASTSSASNYTEMPSLLEVILLSLWGIKDGPSARAASVQAGEKDKDNTYQESSETTSSEPAYVEDIKERLQEIKNKISKLHEDNIALSEIIKRDNNPG